MYQTVFVVIWNLDSSVGIAIRDGLDGSGFRIPAGVSRFLSSTTVLIGSRVHLCNWYLVSFPGTKRPESEVDHACALNEEVKNELSYTSNPPIHSFMACMGTTFNFPTPYWSKPQISKIKSLSFRFYDKLKLTKLLASQHWWRFITLMTLQNRWTEDCYLILAIPKCLDNHRVVQLPSNTTSLFYINTVV
jgi:hypothetical protein